MGGDVNAFTAKEYTCFYARVLDRDLPMAVDHLADMLQHSLIRKADLDAERQVILEEINMHEDSPEDVVHDLFTETLWPEHPLGRPILGTVDTIKAATPQRVRRFYRRHYIPGNFVVVAAGNVRHEDLIVLLRRHLDTGRALRQGQRSSWNLRAGGAQPEPSGRSLMKRRKTEQAHICLGTNGLPRTDPDRFAFLIVNTALGGGMSSRLFQEIREKRVSRTRSTATTPSTRRPGCSPPTPAPRPPVRTRSSVSFIARWTTSGQVVSPSRSSSGRRVT